MGIFNINNNDKYSEIIKNALKRNNVDLDKLNEINELERTYFNFISSWNRYNDKYNEYLNNANKYNELKNNYSDIAINYSNEVDVYNKLVPNEYASEGVINKFKSILDRQMKEELVSLNGLTQKLIKYTSYMDNLKNDINRLATELNDAYFSLISDYKDYFNEDYIYNVIGDIKKLVSTISIGIQSTAKPEVDDYIIRENISNTIDNEINLFNKILEQVNNIKNNNLEDALEYGKLLSNASCALDDERDMTSNFIDTNNKYGESKKRKDKKNIQDTTIDYINSNYDTYKYCNNIFNTNSYTR